MAIFYAGKGSCFKRNVERKDFEIMDKFTKIVTLEENNLPGGFGSAIVEYFNDKNYKSDILRIGLPDNFVDHGTQAELHHLLGIDPDGIKNKVKVFCEIKTVNQGIVY